MTSIEVVFLPGSNPCARRSVPDMRTWRLQFWKDSVAGACLLTASACHALPAPSLLPLSTLSDGSSGVAIPIPALWDCGGCVQPGWWGVRTN